MWPSSSVLILCILCILDRSKVYSFQRATITGWQHRISFSSSRLEVTAPGGRSGGRGGGGRSSSRSGGKDASIRQARVSRSLRDELSSIICDIDIKAVVYPDENLLRATSIVDVDVSADLTYAKVYISVLGNAVEKRQIFVWLCENVGQVRYSLAHRLKHMRRVPEIFFKLSDNQASADLVSLIDKLTPTSSVRDSDDDEFEFEEDDEEEDEEK